jgi:hypothetical protein
MATNVVFAGNSLQTSQILTAEIDMADIPTKDAKLYVLAHANASKIPFTSYPSRTVKISGRLIGTSIANLDALIDTFKGYLAQQDQNLDVDYNGSARRFIATVNATSISRPGGLAWASFSVEFICTNPYGLNTSTTSALSAAGRTASAYTDAYTFLGTAPYQLPIATITLTAVTGGTAQSITWGNGGNGQAISVTRTWAAADVLVIDSVAKTVTVNGLPVAFTGAFPEFPIGAQSLQYNDGFTTRTFTIGVVYTVGYL